MGLQDWLRALREFRTEVDQTVRSLRQLEGQGSSPLGPGGTRTGYVNAVGDSNSSNNRSLTSNPGMFIALAAGMPRNMTPGERFVAAGKNFAGELAKNQAWGGFYQNMASSMANDSATKLGIAVRENRSYHAAMAAHAKSIGAAPGTGFPSFDMDINGKLSWSSAGVSGEISRGPTGAAQLTFHRSSQRFDPGSGMPIGLQRGGMLGGMYSVLTQGASPEVSQQWGNLKRGVQFGAIGNARTFMNNARAAYQFGKIGVGSAMSAAQQWGGRGFSSLGLAGDESSPMMRRMMGAAGVSLAVGTIKDMQRKMDEDPQKYYSYSNSQIVGEALTDLAPNLAHTLMSRAYLKALMGEGGLQTAAMKRTAMLVPPKVGTPAYKAWQAKTGGGFRGGVYNAGAMIVIGTAINAIPDVISGVQALWNPEESVWRQDQAQRVNALKKTEMLESIRRTLPGRQGASKIADDMIRQRADAIARGGAGSWMGGSESPIRRLAGWIPIIGDLVSNEKELLDRAVKELGEKNDRMVKFEKKGWDRMRKDQWSKARAAFNEAWNQAPDLAKKQAWHDPMVIYNASQQARITSRHYAASFQTRNRERTGD